MYDTNHIKEIIINKALFIREMKTVCNNDFDTVNHRSG